MKETKTAMTTGAASAPASPKAGGAKRGKKKAARAGRARSGRVRSAGRRPASIEEARQELLREVCAQSRAITQAVVKEALEGKYLCARFLFEAVGLCAIKGDEVEEASERESLAELLMKQWQLPAQPASGLETVSGEVTEVSELAMGLAPAEDVPVKL